MTGSTQWYCPLCTKSFGRKGDLTRHKLLHTGIKRYICTTCNKAFAQYSGLKTHGNVHTKVKPYLCGLNSCSASFGDPSSCARHRKETHRHMGAYRCPHPLCKSSIKRRSAFAAHLRKHDIDITCVDLDAMASPLSPVAVSVPKQEAVPEIMVIDVMPRNRSSETQLARQMYSDANESTLDQFQSSVPWATNFENSAMAGSSVLSTLPNFPNSNSFNYDNINVEPLFAFAMNSSDSPALISSSWTPPSFETVLPAEPEVEMMANVPRTFDGIRFSSMFKGSALAYPFPHYPQLYPDFKPLAYDLPAINWVQPAGI